LFVGRVVPNKAFDDLIKILYCYHRYIDSGVRLWLVGYDFLPTYRRYLDSLIARLRLQEAVVFAGRVPLADLRTYYDAADLFLCASRHEGFGVPLLESMHFGLPVLAHNCTAVPDTLGTAGVLFNRFNYAEIAEMAHLLVTDADLRARIISRQHQRLADFRPERVEAKLHQVMTQVGAL
jgi:glycosyltransferase involved in cell wall biosynthesis